MEKVLEKVKQTIQEYNMLQKNDSVLLSLSAGKDSMVMLDVFKRLQRDFSLKLACFHLNHQQRGEESDSEEAFLINRAKLYNIPVYYEKYDFLNQPAGQSFEQYARIIRYQLLKTIAEKNNFQKIATAHNQNDVVETVLMRIFTGTGIAGLRGIPYLNGSIIRPLLDISVSEIYDYLNTNNLKWCEDSSNRCEKYTRNKIRNRLIPEIQKDFPDVENSLLSLKERSDEQIKLVNQLITDHYGALIKYDGETVFIYLQINDESLIEKKYFLFHVISEIMRNNFNHPVSNGVLEEMYKNVCVNRSHVNVFNDSTVQVAKTISNKTPCLKIELVNDSKVISDWEYICDLTNKKNCELKIDQTGLHLKFEFVGCNFFRQNLSNRNYVFINLTDRQKMLCVRNRRNGDKIILNKNPKKIKDLLIEKKLDNNSKNFVPILLIDNEIVAFCPGFVFNMVNRVSKKYYVHDKSDTILAVSRID